MHSVTVKYEAETAIADAAALEYAVQVDIERHLRSITGQTRTEVDLVLSIEGLEFGSNRGRVKLKVDGTINQKTVCKTVVSSDRWSADEYWESQADRYVLRAFANFFSLIFRAFLPSTFSSAIGNVRTNGRLLRALDDALAEVRILIDTAMDRPQSSGVDQWKMTKRRALASWFIVSGVAALVFFTRRHQVADQFRAVFGCGLAGIGTAGIVYGLGLIRLPDRFYRSERAGRKLVKLVGVKSPRGIRVVAGGIILLCTCFFAAGVYWLCFE